MKTNAPAASLYDLQDLLPSDVSAAYVGKADRCCCGCAGKYYYRLADREMESKRRGYEVGDEEVSDAKVTKVLRMVQANPEAAGLEPDHVSVEVGRKLYVAYLRAARAEMAKAAS